MKIIKLLLRNQIKEGLRSKNLAGSMAMNIFLGIIYSFLLLELLAAGIFLDEILAEVAPNADKIFLLNAYLIVFAIFDLKLRYFLQKIHGLVVVPYLHLKIKKNALVHYLIGRSFFSLFNLTPLFIIIPAAFNIIMPEYGAISTILWILNFILLLNCASLFTIYISRKSFRNLKIGLVYLLLLLSFVMAYIYNFIDVKQVSYTIYSAVLTNSMVILIPLVVAILLYLINFSFMREHLFIEDLDYSKNKNINAGTVKRLENYGKIGQYLSLELKMIFRNKRPKTTIMFSLFFLLFGFMAYFNPSYKEGEFFYIYFGMFLTGAMMITYGQFLMCWESSYFDLILSSRINLREYLKSKYVLLVFGSTICFILISPFAFVDITILYRNIVLFIYNIGVNAFVMFFLSSYSRKAVDLTVSVMNQQGKGASQYLTVIPTVLLPLVIYFPVEYFGGIYAGYATLGFLGVIGIVFSPAFLDLITVQMSRQKYKMAEGFRA